MTALVAKHQKQIFEYANRKALAETSVRFCITNVEMRSVTFKSGETKERWYLTINVRHVDEKVTVTETLTFDRSDDRDQLFEGIQGELPQHNCYLKIRNFTNKKTGMPQSIYELHQDANDHQCLCDPHRQLEVIDNIPLADKQAQAAYVDGDVSF